MNPSTFFGSATRYRLRTKTKTPLYAITSPLQLCAGMWSSNYPLLLLALLTATFASLLENAQEQVRYGFDRRIFSDETYDVTEERINSTEDGDTANRPTRHITNETREYLVGCGKLFSMERNRIVRINTLSRGKKQYPAGVNCEWNFMGQTPCTPQISCDYVDLRCSDEQLAIFDGWDGGIRLCGDSRKGRAFKPAASHDLFVSFKSAADSHFSRLYRGFQCTVKCAGDSASPLPTATDIFITEESCECGIHEPVTSRIVGGKDASPYEFPWIAALVAPGSRRSFCGGSLINSEFILTAAHCMQDTKSFEVIIHAHDLASTDRDESTVRKQVAKTSCHGYFNKRAPYDYDYCLVKLSSPVDIKVHTPVCLPAPQTPIPDIETDPVVVAGWGYNLEGVKLTSILQKVTLPLVGLPECRSVFNNEYVLTNTMLCAGLVQGGKDACQGDSGGPLTTTIEGKNEYQSKATLTGIVSWGIGCARKNNLGVYSRVSEVVPWIRKHGRKAKWCKR